MVKTTLCVDGWTGAALTGTVTLELLGGRDSDPRKSLEVVSDLVHCMSVSGCTNFNVLIGFSKGTKQWRLYVRFLEEAASSKGTQWQDSIRTKFAFFVPEPIEVPINDLSALEWHDVNTTNWRHLTRFVVYRGSPWIFETDGVLDMEETLTWNQVFIHDLKHGWVHKDLPFHSPPKTLLPLRTMADLERTVARMMDRSAWSNGAAKTVSESKLKREVGKCLLRYACFVAKIALE